MFSDLFFLSIPGLKISLASQGMVKIQAGLPRPDSSTPTSKNAADSSKKVVELAGKQQAGQQQQLNTVIELTKARSPVLSPANDATTSTKVIWNEFQAGYFQ